MPQKYLTKSLLLFPKWAPEDYKFCLLTVKLNISITLKLAGISGRITILKIQEPKELDAHIKTIMSRSCLNKLKNIWCVELCARFSFLK